MEEKEVGTQRFFPLYCLFSEKQDFIDKRILKVSLKWEKNFLLSSNIFIFSIKDNQTQIGRWQIGTNKIDTVFSDDKVDGTTERTSVDLINAKTPAQRILKKRNVKTISVVIYYL